MVPSYANENEEMLAHVSRRVLVLVYVGESSKSVHCRTLRLRESHGRECHVADMIPLVFFLYLLFVFN